MVTNLFIQRLPVVRLYITKPKSAAREYDQEGRLRAVRYDGYEPCLSTHHGREVGIQLAAHQNDLDQKWRSSKPGC